jgi:SAM-dependent methyltransferase
LFAAADYEAHMAAVGQAQANAELVGEALLGLREGGAVLMAGAGTGQIFDYLNPQVLAGYRTTFTDINGEYLAKLAARVSGISCETVVDDIEATALAGPYEVAVAVLVLEHVDWRRAVASLCRVARRAFVVVQEDPPDVAVRALAGTMEVLREARPRLVPRGELVAEFERLGFGLEETRVREVADGKRMVGMWVGARLAST